LEDAMRAALSAVVLVLVVAAAPAAVAQTGPPATVDPHIVDGSAARALGHARARWRASAITSYSFEVRVACFCRPTGFRRVVVVRGVPRHPASQLARVATVPRMFVLIAAAIRRRYAGLDVVYGPRGVPRRISLDPDARIADEETTYAIRRFVRRRPG
jgi:uncharacterized protein DUF6174